VSKVVGVKRRVVGEVGKVISWSRGKGEAHFPIITHRSSIGGCENSSGDLNARSANAMPSSSSLSESLLKPTIFL